MVGTAILELEFLGGYLKVTLKVEREDHLFGRPRSNIDEGKCLGTRRSLDPDRLSPTSTHPLLDKPPIRPTTILPSLLSHEQPRLTNDFNRRVALDPPPTSLLEADQLLPPSTRTPIRTTSSSSIITLPLTTIHHSKTDRSLRQTSLLFPPTPSLRSKTSSQHLPHPQPPPPLDLLLFPRPLTEEHIKDSLLSLSRPSPTPLPRPTKASSPRRLETSRPSDPPVPLPFRPRLIPRHLGTTLPLPRRSPTPSPRADRPSRTPRPSPPSLEKDPPGRTAQRRRNMSHL